MSAIGRLLPVAVVPLAVVALTSCGDDKPDAKPTHTKDGLTTPGSVLSVGDTATVDIADATIELTIKKITKGDRSGLERIEYDDAATTTPYYVDYTVKVIGGTSEGGIRLADHLQATGGGDPARYLLVAKPFPECQDTAVPPFSKAGANIDACLTFITADGAAGVDAIAFSNGDDYDVTEDQQVTWQ